MKVKNLPLYAFIGVITLFTIGYFISAYNISFAFPTGDETANYDNKLKLVKKAAELYGENHMERFGEENNFYITIDDLVKEGYLIADNEEGDYKDPTSDVLTLNDTKIRITNKDGAIEAKILD